MQLPLTVLLRRSRSLAVALTAAHIVAAAGLWPTLLPLLAKLALGLVLAASLIWTLRRPAFAALRLNADGRIAMLGSAGEAIEGSVHPATTVLPILVVLVVAVGGRRRALALPVDALGAEAHRQLRLWLRWKATANAA